LAKEVKNTPLGDEIGKSEWQLKCHLSTDEIHERESRLVEQTRERGEREEALEHWKGKKRDEQKLYEGEIMSLAAKLTRLAKVIQEKEEARPVEVRHFLKDANVTTVRMDTGEIVTSRPATPEELQMPLPTDPPREPGQEG
jgi:aconitase A